MPAQQNEREPSADAPGSFPFSQDDIDAALRHGSGYENGKLRIYALYQHDPTKKDAVKFLKNVYGTYGHSHTFLDGSWGFVDYSSKGAVFRHRDPAYEQKLTWTAIEKRLRELVSAGQYLTEAEIAQYREMEWEYAGVPGGVPTPYPRYGFPTPEQAQSSDAEENLPPSPVVETPPPPSPVLDPQEAIDAAIQDWNGSIESKHAVVRYMDGHAREKGTAAWLRNEYGGDLPAFPVTSDSITTDIPWPKVQRRIAQLIAEDCFYSEAEQDRFDDVDPIAIREELERRHTQGTSPFVEMVMADVERIAQAEQEEREDELPAFNPLAPAYRIGTRVYIDDKPYEVVQSYPV